MALILILFALVTLTPGAFQQILKSTVSKDYEGLQYGINHPCFRGCNGSAMLCEYDFIVNQHYTMGLECGDCPRNMTQCFSPGCIPGGGIVRSVVAVNHAVPGPAIFVCEGDEVEVRVKNQLRTETVSIHWHGIHQEGTEDMDGAPYITQLPILPFGTFKYRFKAKPHGTHMWHGHSGFQDSDGLYGLFIVKRKEPSYVSSLFDYDLPEHTITIWHWYDMPTVAILPRALQLNRTVKGFGLLINGKGPLGPQDDGETWFNNLQPINSQMERLSLDSNQSKVPREIFYVQTGGRYRFRTLFNSPIYCPIQMMIDNHSLVVFSSDTSPFEPVKVEMFMMNSGDRFDFVLVADQKEGCYWIRVKAFGDCANIDETLALLCYQGGNQTRDPQSTPYTTGQWDGTLLNPINLAGCESVKCNHQIIPLVNLNSTEDEDVDYSGKPYDTMYVELVSKPYDQLLHPGPWHQFNNVTFKYPTTPLITGLSEGICSDRNLTHFCKEGFCFCTYVKTFPRDVLIEMVLVDTSVERDQDHPVHMHGNKFYVVATDFHGDSISLDNIKALNQGNKLYKKLSRAPAKDTVSVPSKGYAVIRFFTNNPGYWLFHCHVTNHMEMGMAMVLHVENSGPLSNLESRFTVKGTSSILMTSLNLVVASVSLYIFTSF